MTSSDGRGAITVQQEFGDGRSGAALSVKEALALLGHHNSHRQHQKPSDPAIHFLAANFGAPVYACDECTSHALSRLHSPTASVARVNGDGNKDNTPSTAAVKVLVSLHSDAVSAALLCEPMLRAAGVCPADLRRVLAEKFLLLSARDIGANADADDGRRPTSFASTACTLSDRMAMAQTCNAVGVVVEAEGSILTPLAPPAPDEWMVVVNEDGTQQAKDAISGFGLPVISVSRRGADTLRCHTGACSSTGAVARGGAHEEEKEQEQEQHGIADRNHASCATFVLRREHSHGRSWAQLAPLQDHGAWPADATGRRRLLTRLHRQFGHSEEHMVRTYLPTCLRACVRGARRLRFGAGRAAPSLVRVQDTWLRTVLTFARAAAVCVPCGQAGVIATVKAHGHGSEMDAIVAKHQGSVATAERVHHDHERRRRKQQLHREL